MTKIFQSNSKATSVHYYLSLGILPIRYVIMARRINFLHYLLSRPDTELVKEFFDAQVKCPVKNDWVETVSEDLKYCGIQLSFQEIKKMSKSGFSALVKKKIREVAFQDL